MTSSAAESSAFGLEFDLHLPAPQRNHRNTAPSAAAPYCLGIRPLHKNSLGHWVRDCLDWDKVSTPEFSSPMTVDHADWFDELRTLAAVRTRHTVHDRHWIYLEHYDSPTLWHLLKQAPQLGITLLTKDRAQPVHIATAAHIRVDLHRAPGQNPVLQPNVIIDDPDQSDALPLSIMGLIGQPGHGVFVPITSERRHPLDPFDEPNQFPLLLAPLSTRLTRNQRKFLDTTAGIATGVENIQECVNQHFPQERDTIHVAAEGNSLTFAASTAPEMVLHIEHDDLTIRLDWEWEYKRDGHTIRLPFRPADPLGTEPAKRESTWETAMTKAITRRIPDLEFRRSSYVGYDAVVLMRDWLPALEKIHNLRIETTGTAPAYRPSTELPEITISTLPSEHRDWFDLGITVQVGSFYIPFAEIFSALAQGQEIMMLPDGSWFSLDAPRFEYLRELLREARSLEDRPDDQLRITKHHVGLWQELEELSEHHHAAAQWRDAVNRLTRRDSPNSPTAPAVPPSLQADLRPYQVEGFQWLSSLHDLGLGGILADDMGLGKTIQVIAMFTHICDQLTQAGHTPQPFLVVAPTSVAPNWVFELHKFAPHLRVGLATATVNGGGQSPVNLAATHDVVITSYTLLRLDESLWSAPDWEAVIVDEAQFVKNPRTQAHKVIRGLKATTTIAVTGTPLENGLTDLWSLLSLSAPGLFPSRRRFVEEYQRPIEVSADQNVLARMRRRISPFLLRRSKDAVDLQLPPKAEHTLRIQLSEEHNKLYQLHLQRERAKVLKLLPDLNRNRFTIFSSLTKLRLLALDPSLVDPGSAISSSKLDALCQRLPEIVAEGHQPLVFSQFTSFLSLAAARLDQLNIPYAYLDGSTRERGSVIERFKQGKARVFLISLKAGGTGLNLTEADYCFLLDPWWNPMVENQAIDRAHRIGQDRKVMVYRLVANDTIEEKVMELKERKSQLFDSVMDDDGTFSSVMTADDVMKLLSS